MIDLRPNCVAQFKMNDDAYSPWVAGKNGVPTELVQNPHFINATIWTFGNRWSWYAPGARAYRAPGVNAGNLEQNVGAIAGKTYLTVFIVIAYVDGNLAIELGGEPGTLRSANGVYIEVITAGASPAGVLAINPGSGEYSVSMVCCICLDDFPLTGVFCDSGEGATEDHSVAGKINKALYFNGVNDCILVYDEGALQFGPDTQDFSIAIWFKRARTGIEFLLAKADAAGDGWLLFFHPVTHVIAFYLNTKSIWGATPINDTDWHLVKIVVDRDGNAQIYLDNVADGAAVDVSGETMSISAPLRIGENYLEGNRFQGDIDVTSFFDKALSEAERDMLWHGGKGTERLISLHHHIYRGQDGDIDYSSLVAEMALDDSQVTIPDQDLPVNTIWHYIRRQIDDECGLESDDSPACIVAIDSNGDMIGSTPNPPISLMIERLSNGRFRLRWRYTKLSEEVAPTGFKIYMDSGSGFNFTSPDATIAYGISGINNEFSWISGALTHGQIYRFCVRSYRTSEGESQNTDYVAADADSEGPAAITDLQASYEEI